MKIKKPKKKKKKKKRICGRTRILVWRGPDHPNSHRKERCRSFPPTPFINHFGGRIPYQPNRHWNLNEDDQGHSFSTEHSSDAGLTSLLVLPPSGLLLFAFWPLVTAAGMKPPLPPPSVMAYHLRLVLVADFVNSFVLHRWPTEAVISRQTCSR